MIVVDASVLVTALGDDGVDGRRVRRRLAGERMTAPELVDIEVTSVLRRLTNAGKLAPDRAKQALGDLVSLRIARVSHRPLLERCWELRENVSPYDAVYVALAELLGVPLLTADERLVAAPGVRCSFEVLS